jgi:Domain of unknown function (DUF4157)
MAMFDRALPDRGREVPQATVRTALSSPGHPLPHDVAAAMRARFDHDFTQVRVHADNPAARSAAALGANAYTIGHDIVFGPGRYAPGTPTGSRLLAHELAHVVQQAGARPDLDAPLPVSSPSDAPEVSALRAGELSAVHDVHPPTSPLGVGRAPVMVQRDFGAPLSDDSGLRGADAVIPIDTFVRYVEDVERANPRDRPQEILSRIRVQYYGSASLADISAFSQLIPDARAYDVETVVTLRGGARTTVVPRSLGRVPEDTRRHLRAHADENRVGDNPSPYLLLPSGERIDVGHLLLGMDAQLHPRTASPYSDYGVPNVDPAGWVADVGIASVWLTHAEEGHPHKDVPRNPPPPATVDEYFRMSAPDEDLLGDVDAYRAEEPLRDQSTTLSAAIRRYYLGGTGTAGMGTRYRTFCSREGFTYRRSGATVDWNTNWRQPMIDRINRFNDLYESGASGAARAMVTGGTSHRPWPRTPDMLDKFLSWLKPRLEAELRTSSQGGGPQP